MGAPDLSKLNTPMWKLYFRYASIMLPKKGGTNCIFDNRDMCVWLARAQARAITANVRILM